MSKISNLCVIICRLDAYFSKLIFVLKPWVQAGRFECHKPYNPKNLLGGNYKGVPTFQKIAVRVLQMKI